MDKNKDECYDYAKMIDTSMELLINTYNSLKRIDENNPSMEDISDINKLSQDISMTINDIESKIIWVKSIIDKCFLNHDELKKAIIFKEASTNKLKINFYREREKKIKFLSTYVPKISFDYSNDKDLSEYSMDELILEEEKLKKVKELVYEKEKGLDMSEEDKKQIIQLKNQIKELMVIVKENIDQANENLVNIDDNADEIYSNILKGNEELKQAALLKNKTKRMKYQTILGTILGVAGSVFPGIGNAIGVALGIGIGTGIAKIEEKAINNIGKKKK